MYKNFFKIVLGGISGSLLGIASGFALGIIINLLILLSNKIFGAGSNEVPPQVMVSFLSLGFGAVIGGICGIVFVFKNKNQ